MSRALYKQVTDNLLEQIGNGELSVGQRLPSEEVYAEQLGVSRSTLRLAFTQLEQKGIIRRRKRGGTEIISDKPMQRFNLVGSGVFDLLSIGKTSVLVISDVDKVTVNDIEDLADYHDVAKNWTSFAGVRFAPDYNMPFACTHVYVPDYYAEIEIHPGDQCESVFGVIEKQYGVSVTRLKQLVSASACPGTSASNLGLEEADPVVSYMLELKDESDRILEVARTYYDPARVNIQAEIQIGV